MNDVGSHVRVAKQAYRLHSAQDVGTRPGFLRSFCTGAFASGLLVIRMSCQI
jgi:hypothetical protein